MEGTKKDVKYGIHQFNSLRQTITIDELSFGNHVDLWTDISIKETNSIHLEFWILKFSTKVLTDTCIFLIKAVMFLIPLKITR